MGRALTMTRTRRFWVAVLCAPTITLLCALAHAQAKDASAGSALRRDPEFIVPVVALADRAHVNRVSDRLHAARMPYFIEPIATERGTVYRIRTGPFASRARADEAVVQLQRMGLSPGPPFERK